MSNWQAVGQQKFLVDDDTVHWNLCGKLSGHELVTIFEEGVRIQDVHGYALFCINITGDWAFPSEARQALAQFHRTHTANGASAIVGISAKTAMFIDIVLRGVAKVSGRRPKTRFFGALPEATTWLGEERVQFVESLGTQKKQ
jgi:hypothetical protein